MGEFSPRTLALVMRRHPHPSPPPQAGEGVQQRKAPYRLMRDAAEFLMHFNLIFPVQSHLQKYFSSPLTQITCIPRRPVPHRGAFRDRHGRWERDAVDAGGAADESAGLRTAKSCGPDASTPASSLAEGISADDGDKQARSPGRARRKPLKPLRAGTPGVSGVTVVTTLVCFFHFAREAAGAAGARRSPRPLSRRAVRAQPGRIAPRDRGVASEIVLAV
jgi:hypothetical protein